MQVLTINERVMKIFKNLLILLISCVCLWNCSEDDGPEPIPPRDRGEEAIRAQAEIEEFLETHFYNYEDFQADPENFKLVFDTIAGDNASKTPFGRQ